MLISTSYALDPVLDIIDQLEHGDGHVHTDAKGVPIFKPRWDQGWFAMVPALQGIVEMFEAWGVRHDRNVPLDPVRQLARRLELDMPITALETQAVRRVLPALRRIGATMSRTEADYLIRNTQIKELLEGRAA